MAKRGITDLTNVQIDPWPASNFGDELDATGRRLGRGEVVEVQDGDVVPIPSAPGRYDATSVEAEAGGSLREMAPLSIIQPDGPGFTLGDGALR